MARRAPGGPRERPSPALTPGQRRRLDLYKRLNSAARRDALFLAVSGGASQKASIENQARANVTEKAL